MIDVPRLTHNLNRAKVIINYIFFVAGAYYVRNETHSASQT